MRLLRALDCALTAFVNEISPYPFPILSDSVAESLEYSPSSAALVSPEVQPNRPGSCEHSAAPEPGPPIPVVTADDLRDAAVCARQCGCPVLAENLDVAAHAIRK